MLLESGKLSSEELVAACLERIAQFEVQVSAFITVLAEESMEEARLLDGERRAGRSRGPLHGIPIAVKDNIDVRGVRTTAGSAVFRERVPTADAEVVRAPAAGGGDCHPARRTCRSSVWAVRRWTATMARYAILGIWRVTPADLQAGQPWRWRWDLGARPSARIPAGQCGRRQRIAASPD